MAVREPEPTERTKRVLFGTATCCGFPSCPEPLIYQYDGLLTINVDVAHIRSGVARGPRYVHGYDRVREFENVLLLCHKHHRLVDDHPGHFSIEMLEDWKEKQIASAGTPVTDELVIALRQQITDLATTLDALTTHRRGTSVRLLCGRGSSSEAVMLPLAEYQKVKFEEVVSITYLGVEVRDHAPLHLRAAGLEFGFDDLPSSVFLAPELTRRTDDQEIRLIHQNMLHSTVLRLCRSTHRLPQRFRAFASLSDESQVSSDWMPMIELPIWREGITPDDLYRWMRGLE